MLLNTVESLQFTDKKLATFLILLVLELFFDGKNDDPTIVFNTLFNHLMFFLLIVGAEAASKAEIERHLELGRDLLQRGQLQDALVEYHAAVG